MDYLSATDVRGLGLLQEVNRIFFHPIGLAAELDPVDGRISIQDHRDDPEGVVFAEGVLDIEKALSYWRMKQKLFPIREKALGFIIQEVPDPRWPPG